MLFNIQGIVGQVGSSVIGYKIYVVEINTELNDHGDETSVDKTEHLIEGIVQIVSAEDDEVQEGILRPKDLICFFDENAPDSKYLINYNQIKYRDKYYKIVQVINEIGHIEVLAKVV